MPCHSIRRLTREEREARDAYEAYSYDEIMEHLISQERAEYEKNFGAFYKEKHPFMASHNIHEKVDRMIRAERADNELERAAP